MSKKFRWKEKMYCVTSCWGVHRCYQMKEDAEKDAKRNTSKKYDRYFNVVECDVVITPIYKDKK